MPDSQVIRNTVRDFILKEFLPGEDPAALSDTTPLMTTGILDSLATLKLVTFMEEQFKIQVAAHEADTENLNTIDDIVRLISSKMA